jgi:predicted GNAT superfamily acetyltransferase
VINFVVLNESPHQSFAQTLYTSAFEADERREFSQIFTLTTRNDFRFYVLEDSQSPIAILALWNFETFCYIEHFAVDNNLRNGGRGTTIIQDIISKSQNPIVLEVELPMTPMAQRRIRFYERLGFVLLPFDYFQPPYSPDKKPVAMHIMTTDTTPFNHQRFETIKQTLYNKVYNY